MPDTDALGPINFQTQVPNDMLWHQIETMKAEITSLSEQMIFLRKEIEARELRIQDTLLQLHGQMAFSFDARDIRL